VRVKPTPAGIEKVVTLFWLQDSNLKKEEFMFDFLKGGKIDLKVTFDRAPALYFPGESILATISLDSEKELKIKEGRVVLFYRDKFEYTTTTQTTDSDGNTETSTSKNWRSDDYEQAQDLFILGETTIPKGFAQTYDFVAQVPESFPTTYRGKIIIVQWLVKATLDRKLAGDINAEAEATVLVAPTGERAPVQLGQSDEPGEADFSFELPDEEWVSGETISGSLVIRPQKSFEATEVRVELVQSEHVSYDEGNTNENTIKVKLAGKTKLNPSETLRLPFQVQIPQTCAPSGSAGHWSVTWKLKGVLARFLRKDTFGEAVIRVYSGHRS
jgi:hypothetical protein